MILEQFEIENWSCIRRAVVIGLPTAGVPGRKARLALEPPVTDGQFVYAFFGNGILGCVDSSGKQIWAGALVSGGPKICTVWPPVRSSTARC